MGIYFLFFPSFSGTGFANTFRTVQYLHYAYKKMRTVHYYMCVCMYSTVCTVLYIQNSGQKLDIRTLKCTEYSFIDSKAPEARKCIELLRRYFFQVGNEGGPQFALDTCSEFVQQQSVKKTCQVTMDRFLQH